MTATSHLDATRLAYDTVAANYSEQLRDHLAGKATDRAILTLVADETSGPVLDVGCGPGHVTAFLAALGADVSGLDLSPAMVARAAASYPGIRFTEGSMADLKQRDLGGIVAWYSIIHTPPDELPGTFASFRRALRSDGMLALAFQVGNERRHIEHGYGHDVSVDAYRLDPSAIQDQLVDASFRMQSVTVRQPDADESVPQAYLVARAA